MAIKKALRDKTFNVLRKALTPYYEHQRFTSVSKAEQILLTLKYRELAAEKKPFANLQEFGFSNFSQNDEDGILLYLFSVIGTTNRKSVEICAGDGVECNTANLIFYHGWKGLLVDGNPENKQKAAEFYSRYMETRLLPPCFINSWITAENVNGLLTENGFEGEIDLFSLDMDGIDYWLWKALTAVNPRVVVVEYITQMGADRAVAIPYRPDFIGQQSAEAPYHGASLPAFAKLAQEKGYRLVGCSRNYFNAFFIRNDIAPDLLPEVSVASCINMSQEQLARVQLVQASQEWVEV